MGDLIYAYCMTNCSPVLDQKPETKSLKYLVCNGYYTIVKNVSSDEFSDQNFKKNLSDTKWLESNAMEHIRIIRMIMEYSDVIPFKFGTIYNSQSCLEEFIKDYSGSLNENFKNIRGKKELSVKVYCNRQKLGEKLDELNADVVSLEKEIMASSPGRAFLLKRKKADFIVNEIDRLCKNHGLECLEEFKKVSESTSLNNLLPKEFTGREDTMILNSSFLVDKNKVSDFIGTAENLKKRDGNSGFTIETAGPWPPFSFVSIKRNSNGE
jgi:hypothetical protein